LGNRMEALKAWEMSLNRLKTFLFNKISNAELCRKYQGLVTRFAYLDTNLAIETLAGASAVIETISDGRSHSVEEIELLLGLSRQAHQLSQLELEQKYVRKALRWFSAAGREYKKDYAVERRHWLGDCSIATWTLKPSISSVKSQDRLPTDSSCKYGAWTCKRRVISKTK
jgi:hypothetical protein